MVQPVPLPLPAALQRAERIAYDLSSARMGWSAFLLRGHTVRLCSMVGGWRVPPRSSEVQPCMPASEFFRVLRVRCR